MQTLRLVDVLDGRDYAVHPDAIAYASAMDSEGVNGTAVFVADGSNQPVRIVVASNLLAFTQLWDEALATDSYHGARDV